MIKKKFINWALEKKLRTFYPAVYVSEESVTYTHFGEGRYSVSFYLEGKDYEMYITNPSFKESFLYVIKNNGKEVKKKNPHPVPKSGHWTKD